MLLMTLLMTMVMMQLMTNYLRMVPPMISVVSRVLAEPTKNDPAVLRHNHPHHDYLAQIIIMIFFLMIIAMNIVTIIMIIVMIIVTR